MEGKPLLFSTGEAASVLRGNRRWLQYLVQTGYIEPTIKGEGRGKTHQFSLKIVAKLSLLDFLTQMRLDTELALWILVQLENLIPDYFENPIDFSDKQLMLVHFLPYDPRMPDAELLPFDLEKATELISQGHWCIPLFTECFRKLLLHDGVVRRKLTQYASK